MNQWRDCIKPRQILDNYCKQNHVSGPHFYGNNSVKVGKKIHNLADYGESHSQKQCSEAEIASAIEIVLSLIIQNQPTKGVIGIDLYRKCTM